MRKGRAATTWRLRASLLRGAVRRRALVTATTPGPARRPALRDLPGGARVVPTTEAGEFAVEVDPVPAAVDEVGVDHDHLVLRGWLRAAVTGLAGVALGGGDPRPHAAAEAAPDGQRFTAGSRSRPCRTARLPSSW